MTTRPLAEIKARPPGRRLVASATDETKSRLQAAVARASPSSATKMVALEQWNDGAIVRLLLLLGGRGVLPRRLLTTQLSVTGWAAEKESERMMPATRSTVSIVP